MRLKISLCVLITLCGGVYNTHGFAIKATNKITSNEWHCTNICKSCYGEPYFDKINEKCYCSLRKGNSIEDRTCRDAMKMNAKLHDIHLIIKEIPEPSNRVRREEPEIEITTPKTEIIQTTNKAATETLTDAPEPIVAEGNPESTATTTIKPAENANLVAATNTKARANSNKNVIERKARPQKLIGATRKSSGTQDKQIDDLVAEAQQKVEEFVVIHRQNPKEAQNKIKDIQGTFNKVASRLKQTNEPPTLQERINQFEERLASRKVTTAPSTLIVEPENLGETNPEENANNAIVGSRRHPSHRQRIPLSRRITTHNEEHLRPRLSHNENEENTRARIRLGRLRLRDRLGAKNPTETTTQINEEMGNDLNNEITSAKNTETINETKTDELLTNANVENVETNPINNEI
ncbi:uncharacterized protein LOC123290633 [Chrysoperla carnea]|uniref:uncharacterized protein LOC123290633 n=1 Tax=Chrysoperla carnea TaxID=189513 RepID=UPI001D05F4D8|nr:uncharacterized protein LOC123290633 [Chrysoperla carnea]